MIEGYMFEEYEMICWVVIECMCNLVMSKEVQDFFEVQGNDWLKLLVLYSGEDDELLQWVVVGGLVMFIFMWFIFCSCIF